MDLAADPRYHQLREEVDKLGALTGAAVDWRRVDALADDLSHGPCLDVQVLAYAALAACKLRGLAGALAALDRLAAALTGAAPLTPQRPRARANALEWLLTRLLPELTAPPATAPEVLRELPAALRRLRGAARQALGDLAPSFGPVLAAGDALAPPAPPAPAPPDTSSQAPASPTSARAPALASAPSDTSSLAPATPHTRDDALAPAPSGTSTPPHAAPATPHTPASPTSAPAHVLAPAPSDTSSPPHAAPAPTDAPPHAATPAPSDAITELTPTALPHPAPSDTLPAPPAPARPPEPPSSAPALEHALRDAGDLLERAAHRLRASAPTDPRAIRLLRTALWLHLHEPPPLRPDGATRLVGLSARDRALLDECAAAGRWPALLARSENLLVEHRLALDLQRHSAAALAALDAGSALLALRAELRALLTRLPGLPDLRDRDGAPLADPATRRWLATEVLPAASPVSEDTPIADLAARLAGPGRQAALAEAQARISASPSGHVRWARRLALAEACERARDPLAGLLFRRLVDDLAPVPLADHEPDLAARCLAGLARLDPGPAVLERLAALDPAAAAALLAPPSPRA